MLNERPGHTLQTTALVHEAYLRLAKDKHFEPVNPGHFYKCAAEAMRRILIEHARKKHRVKHGGKWTRVPAYDVAERQRVDCIDLLALDRALSLLEIKDARKAEMVKLYYFAGFSVTESADILGISTATAKRDLAFARAWMRTRADEERV